MNSNIKKKNIFLKNTIDAMPYNSTSSNAQKKIPQRNIKSHAKMIEEKLHNCYEQLSIQQQAVSIKFNDGIYLEISGACGYDLCTKSLESKKNGIHLLNIHNDIETKTVKAIIYIPFGKETYFLNKIEAYANEKTKSGKPKNNDLINSIEDIKLAILESFWKGDLNTIPDNKPVWCELWLRFDSNYENKESRKNVENNIMELCKKHKIHIENTHIIFPERLVKLIYVNIDELKLLIRICPFIAEIHRAQEVTSFFENISNSEQKEWVKELLSRTTYQDNDIYICLLDTGISPEHPLIKPAIEDKNKHVQSLKPYWKAYDTQGHGTEMAGTALFYDLKQALETQNQIIVSQRLESIKILPETNDNSPELYGAITEQAVSLAEINNPFAKRIICMAVTSEEYNTFDGSPTSWSASIDNITSGANENDEKRLFIVSAGNVYPDEFIKSPYPNANLLHCIESPGQSWNAITVGAYSADDLIKDFDFKGFLPLAKPGQLSPYSSTSQTWNNKWPIKPDVLFNGGNMATNNNDYTECPDLSLLTTNHNTLLKQFSTIYGTSSATAQAAWFSAQLLNEYPDMWPETIRALMIHSASWTSEMKKQFCYEDTKTKGRHQLLRTCGYGIPDLKKAIQCLNNSVNMIIQSELQPYDGNKMNEMHMHKLPWPNELLRSLGSTNVTLRVTLSYFIEPSPGSIGWKDKYRYASCGLRFDVINSNESIDDFKKRVNMKMRGENKKDSGEGTSGSERWYLGAANRDVGSIHSDFCTLNAVDLCECKYIAIYPVVGWWRERKHLGRSNKRLRYSLVVTLSTPEIDVDLYTPIMTQIENTINIPITL